jgi:4-carboxymuconolactone decarboxylase
LTPRLPPSNPQEFSEAQRDLYTTVTGEWHANPPTSESGELKPPYNVWLYAPKVGKLSHAFATGLRDALTLPERSREFAILIVAARPFSDFIWHAHLGRARALGISDEQIEALRVEGQPEIDDPIDSVVVEAARAIVKDRDLDDELYERATQLLGPQGLVELLALCGWYQSLALQFQVFRVPAAEA